MLHSESYAETMLTAVNLGEDTDMVAVIAGGLAGLYFGYDGIPEEWRNTIIKKEGIVTICEMMEKI